MAFDYKKEYKEFYLPPQTPVITEIPSMNYLAVRGKGNPNEKDGEYQQAVGLLYAVAYTIKMSRKGARPIDGYFDFVVPPLEGFWWQNGVAGADYSKKETFHWISVIRLPDFVARSDFKWAVSEAARKKKTDFGKVEWMTCEEGLCVQCMHVGPYDSEPETVAAMHAFAAENGFEADLTETRRHHEIYLTDPRRVQPPKMKTVIRHPIKKLSGQ